MKVCGVSVLSWLDIFGILCTAGVLDYGLVVWLGLCTQSVCFIHGGVIALYAIENWTLLRDLERTALEKADVKLNMHPVPCEGELVSKILVKNLKLEKRVMELEAQQARPRSVLSRSWRF